MTSRGASAGTTRRGLLVAGGAGLVALAGCSAVGRGGVGEDDSAREYDPGSYPDLAGAEAPTPPDAFPVAISGALLETHLERARSLVEAVPERPDVPNGVVADHLERDRQHLVEALDEAIDEPTARERLGHARGRRGDAAELDGAYRAATGGLDPGAVEERRAALRADRLALEGAWDYRGGDRAASLVVHAAIESLLETARRDGDAWPPVPADPADDPFQAGDALGEFERARAALLDAERFRRAHLEGVDDPRSFRSAYTVAAHRLDRRALFDRRLVHEHLDRRVDEAAVGRSLEDTPGVHLYRTARRGAESRVRGADRPRRRGAFATAALEGARLHASLRAFEAVLDALEAGEYAETPSSADAVAEERSAAVDALERAWAAEPVPVSVAVAVPARHALERGHWPLRESGRYGRTVDEAVGEFAYARRYAEAVPDAVAVLVDELAAADERA